MKKVNSDETIVQYNKAVAAERYMVAIWWLEDGEIKLYRKTNDFPIPDFALALNLLEKNLEGDLSSKKNPNE